MRMARLYYLVCHSRSVECSIEAREFVLTKIPVQVDNGATVTALKRVIEFHSGVSEREQQLWHNNRQLQDRQASLWTDVFRKLEFQSTHQRKRWSFLDDVEVIGC